jgi:glycosyltransferase involved in cell wall biosynthesis
MATRTPRVSVLMPVYNCRPYLARAIESILGQTFRDLEFIIVDDGSTDDSMGIIQKYQAHDPRVRLIRRPNTGIVGALNDGLRAARGEFIARMDGDDISLTDRFDKQVRFLDLHPECVAVGGSVLVIDADGDPIREGRVPTEIVRLNGELLRWAGSGLIHPTVMMRTAAVRLAGAYRKEFEWSEDKDLWLRLAEVGQLRNLHDCVLHQRAHTQNVSHTRRATQLKNRIRLIEDACTRRGLNVSQLALESANVTRPAIDTVLLMKQWCYDSLGAGMRPTARKYARRIVVARPTQLESWWLVIKTHLGASMASRLKSLHLRLGGLLCPKGKMF